MATRRNTQPLEIEGRHVTVSNLDKPLYPSGYTKGQVIDYYIRVSDYVLPHLKGRPITLKRYPNGIGAPHFYEKDAPRFTPPWIRTFPVPRRSGESEIRYVVIDDLASLVWCANTASIELHPFLHRVPEIDKPTALVFDLDPGEGAGVLACAAVAFMLKEKLASSGLHSYAKVSAPPEGIPGAFVITSGYGLAPPETVITREHLAQIASIPIDATDPRYREPLERACRTLDEIAGPDCDFILLGSVATLKYLEPMFGIFGHRLMFPEEFIGRGDMSRGGLMLRCARAGAPLTYVPLGNLTRHGPRPPKLPKLSRERENQ